MINISILITNLLIFVLVVVDFVIYRLEKDIKEYPKLDKNSIEYLEFVDLFKDNKIKSKGYDVVVSDDNDNDTCIYRPDRAHCTEFQCIPSANSVHAFRKAEQSFDLLDYERSYLKNCVNGAFMPALALAIDSD